MKRLKTSAANDVASDAFPDTWTWPAEILRLRKLTLHVRCAYAALWQFAGRKPGKLTVDYVRLAIALGASERACRRWVATLEGAGLVEVLAREPGQAQVRVRDWRGGEPPAERSDPQMQLDIIEEAPQEAAADSIPIWRHRQGAGMPNAIAPSAG